jgi:hypothetical protein
MLPDQNPSFHFYLDPDPTFHFDANLGLTTCCGVDTDPGTHQSDSNLRPWLHLKAYIVSVHSTPEPDAETDQAFDFDTDPDPAVYSDAGPDPDPASPNDAKPCGSGSVSRSAMLSNILLNVFEGKYFLYIQKYLVFLSSTLKFKTKTSR